MSTHDVIDLEEFESKDDESSRSDYYTAWAKQEPPSESSTGPPPIPTRPPPKSKPRRKQLTKLNLAGISDPTSLAIVQAAPPEKREAVAMGARLELAKQAQRIAAAMARAEKQGKKYTPNIPLALRPMEEQMEYFDKLNRQYQEEKAEAEKQEGYEKKAIALFDPKVKKEIKKEREEAWIESRKEARRLQASGKTTKRVAFEQMLPDTSDRQREEETYRQWQVKKEETDIPPPLEIQFQSNRNNPIELDDD